VPQLAATWDLDVWGKVRRQVESNVAGGQVSAANLANAKLSQQAMLATAYFNLRAADSLHDLLDRTVREYKRTLDIVQNQFKAGYSVTAGDVASAPSSRPRRRRRSMSACSAPSSSTLSPC
jgi:outer membrane protein TolC